MKLVGSAPLSDGMEGNDHKIYCLQTGTNFSAGTTFCTGIIFQNRTVTSLAVLLRVEDPSWIGDEGFLAAVAFNFSFATPSSII